MKDNLFLYLLIFLLFSQCSRRHEAPSEQQVRETEEALVGVNRMLVQKDREIIRDYISKHNLNLQESESGLWYGITKKGTGNPVKDNSLVTLDYKVYLLNGKLCYSSDSLGNKQFRTGKGGVESGVDEGVRMLSQGSEAIFILPPHLAHGLQGDGDRIPARSVIVYYVKIINVES
jgi:FKBP-type peptidyl-prolyl cis-trans isomerase